MGGKIFARVFKIQKIILRHLKAIPLEKSHNEIRNFDLKKIRNIGILAHVDAGKTSTTEKMLYLAGCVKTLGKVDDGNTVTDFLPQEQERGITIMSAAVKLDWNGFTINLLDTPGHVDFCVEVERCLRVMDGAVLILDASAGVEAQTYTVWKQLRRFKIPTICYLNKMDKGASDINLCLNSLATKLDVTPLLLQYVNEELEIIDLLNTTPYEKDIQIAQTKLIDTLAELDETLLGVLLSCGDHSSIPRHVLTRTLSKLLQNQHIDSSISPCTILPVLVGTNDARYNAKYNNIYVKSLLDAIVNYLPSPELSQLQKNVENSNIATNNHEILDPENTYFTVFKQLYHKQSGLLSLIRLYSGTLTKGQNLTKLIDCWNLSPTKADQIERVGDVWDIQGENISAIGNNPTHKNSAKAGQFAVVSGLKTAKTGDCYGAIQLCKNLQRYKAGNVQFDNSIYPYIDHIVSQHLTYKSLHIPEPMFFCTVDAENPSAQRELDKALGILSQEDPTLRIHSSVTDAISNPTSLKNPAGTNSSTILSGLGELHIQIVKDRLRTEFNGLKAYLGPLTVAYKESIRQSVQTSFFSTKIVNDRKVTLQLTLSFHPKNSALSSNQEYMDTSFTDLVLKHTKDNQLGRIPKQVITSIERALVASLSFAGPIKCSPIIGTDVHLHALSCYANADHNSQLIERLKKDQRLITDDANEYIPEAFITPALLNSRAFRDIVCDITVPTVVQGCVDMALYINSTQMPSSTPIFNTILLEPYVNLSIVRVPTHRLSIVKCDLNQRRSSDLTITSIPGSDDVYYDLTAEVPLINMADFAGKLRSLTSGISSFQMSFCKYMPTNIV